MTLAPTVENTPTAAEALAVTAGAADSERPVAAREVAPESFFDAGRAPESGHSGKDSTGAPAATASILFEAGDDVAAVLAHSTDQSGTRLGVTPVFRPASGAPASSLLPPRDCGRGDNTPSPILFSESAAGDASADPFKSSDEWRITEANRRLELVNTYRALMEQGHSGKKAAELMRADHVSLWRYNKAFEAQGYTGLIPNTDKRGRKSELQKLRELLGSELLDQILNEIKGINLDTESTTAALRVYAASDRCPPELADIILDPTRCSKHALPPSLRKAATPNENSRLAHRGARKLSLGGIYTPRRNDVLPGDIFSADDTTPIWAWWVPWVQSEDYPFGVKLLQGQFIPVIDVASQCIVSFVLIAREKSSYRASDIWNLFGHTFETVGLPRLGFQLERGSWEANIIRGQEIDYREDEVTMQRRVGGLRQLPTTDPTSWHHEHCAPEAIQTWPKTLQTWTSYLPKSKSIEGWFNRHQTFEGTLWGALGRDQMRNPFEKTKKKFQECQRGADDPRNHFLSGTEIAARIKGLIDYVNGEPMEGEVFAGIPRLKFDQACAEHPLYFMPEETRYLYRRDWRTLQITKGYARVRLSDPFATTATGRRYSLFYFHPRFAEVEGEEVVVYYDRENFETPAQIHLARNGEFLCEAQYVERTGGFLEGDLSGHDIRKQWRNAVLSIYGTIVNHAPSRQLPREIEQRRAAARALPANGSDVAVPPPSIELRATKPVIVPTKRNIFSPPKPEEIIKRRSRLEEEAELARHLRAQVTE